MHLALNLNVQVKDGTLVLTDGVGKTVTFSEAQSVQKKVSMITLGDFCGLPKRELATAFGFKSRTSYYDSRNAVLQGDRGRPPTPTDGTTHTIETHQGARGAYHRHAFRDQWHDV